MMAGKAKAATSAADEPPKKKSKTQPSSSYGQKAVWKPELGWPEPCATGATTRWDARLGRRNVEACAEHAFCSVRRLNASIEARLSYALRTILSDSID